MYSKRRDSGEVHIFLDSDYVARLLTDGVTRIKSYKYYRSVESVRRLAATMSDFQFILHWIPSHLSHGCHIPGNVIADQLAGQASRVRTAATHDEFFYDTQKAILREVASLVGGIERLFPLELDGPSPRARDVARRAKPGGAKRRRDAPG